MSATTNGNADGLSIIVVGAGIAGLAVATGLSQKGHKVTVLESKPALNEFGASIGILPNGVRVLQSWGLQQEFEKVVTKNNFLEARDGITNQFIGHIPHNKNNAAKTQYGTEIWNINRRDYQDTLARAAEANGVKTAFDAVVEKVDVDRCIVMLQDGRELAADCIIGADGMNSAVRKSIPATAHVEPLPLEEACFRCTVKKESMCGNPKLQWLLESGNEMGWLGPGKYVLSWPLPPNRDYDVVTSIQRPSDVPVGRWGVTATPDEARREFQDFCPEVVELLSHIDTAVKWTLAELPPLKTCRSDNGKVVLIGDAFHALIPHIAMGGNSALEDAACISEAFDWSYRTGRDVAAATQAFEHLRKARVERMQTGGHEGYGFLGAKGDFVAVRNAALAEQSKMYDADLALPEEVRRTRPKPEPDMNVRFPGEPMLQWLYTYDAAAVTKQYLAQIE